MLYPSSGPAVVVEKLGPRLKVEHRTVVKPREHTWVQPKPARYWEVAHTPRTRDFGRFAKSNLLEAGVMPASSCSSQYLGGLPRRTATRLSRRTGPLVCLSQGLSGEETLLSRTSYFDVLLSPTGGKRRPGFVESCLLLHLAELLCCDWPRLGLDSSSRSETRMLRYRAGMALGSPGTLASIAMGRGRFSAGIYAQLKCTHSVLEHIHKRRDILAALYECEMA